MHEVRYTCSRVRDPSCVDDPQLARVLSRTSLVACGHVSGLWMRSHMNRWRRGVPRIEGLSICRDWCPAEKARLLSIRRIDRLAVTLHCPRKPLAPRQLQQNYAAAAAKRLNFYFPIIAQAMRAVLSPASLAWSQAAPSLDRGRRRFCRHASKPAAPRGRAHESADQSGWAVDVGTPRRTMDGKLAAPTRVFCAGLVSNTSMPAAEL